MLARFLVCCVAQDLIQAMFLFSPRTRSVFSASFASQPLGLQLALAWAYGLQNYFGVTASHSIIAFSLTLLRLHDPQDWAPPFGSVSDAYTVGRFWG
jgi:hypothetical protein